MSPIVVEEEHSGPKIFDRVVELVEGRGTEHTR